MLKGGVHNTGKLYVRVQYTALSNENVPFPMNYSILLPMVSSTAQVFK
jgi:hypothetical protein